METFKVVKKLLHMKFAFKKKMLSCVQKCVRITEEGNA